MKKRISSFFKNHIFFLFVSFIICLTFVREYTYPSQVIKNQALFSSSIEQCNLIKLDWIKTSCITAVISQKKRNCSKFHSDKTEYLSCIEESQKMIAPFRFHYKQTFFVIAVLVSLLCLTIFQRRIYTLYLNHSVNILNTLDKVGDFFDTKIDFSKKIGIPEKVFHYFLFLFFAIVIIIVFSFVISYGWSLR